MSERQSFLSLRSTAPHIAPSMLLCDFGNLEREVRRLEDAGAALLHLDVMDGQFVPNMTYGLPIVEAFRRLTSLPLDVHLMIADPGKYLQAFVAAGASAVTFHVEATPDPRPLLEELRRLDVAGGVAFNPATELTQVVGCLDLCDLVLVMSVPAGFGGQKFHPNALEKLQALRRSHPELLLEVDGGVNPETIAQCTAAGADLLVVGSAIFKHNDYTERMRSLTALAGTGVKSAAGGV